MIHSCEISFTIACFIKSRIIILHYQELMMNFEFRCYIYGIGKYCFVIHFILSSTMIEKDPESFIHTCSSNVNNDQFLALPCLVYMSYFLQISNSSWNKRYITCQFESTKLTVAKQCQGRKIICTL